MNTIKQAVLLTGAPKRIGLSLARECLKMGFSVIIHYRSSPEPALSELSGHPDVFFIKCDLSDCYSSFSKKIMELPVILKGLVNNASLFTSGDLSNPDHLKELLEINVMAPVRLVASLAPLIKKGWVINITDAYIDSFNRKFQNYRISKKILTDITKQMASLYAPEIRVNAIAPGAILPAESGQETRKQFDGLKTKIPLKETGNLKTIGQTFRFLVENDYICGEVIRVDGGLHLSC
ncbi:SDR family oxidoreductase [Chitinispirillales bacterium ANBcel5]|uniref:SDR family oxidoreductase n=1 Tax=Cellulosispirillum alkaliphilum TaxID=3039283 RepID=UPI002A57C3E1|nr:SDR family oxidoreductase [Chitinispirillales bacterium ANBcel5]